MIADLKKIYQAATVVEAEQALEDFRSSVGREVSDNRQDVACQVDRHHHALRFSARDPPSDLHHQRDRIGQQRDPQVHAEPQDLSQRRVRLEDRVHGDSRGVQEMDDADSPLEAGTQPLRHPVRGPHARANQQITYPARLTQKFYRPRSTNTIGLEDRAELRSELRVPVADDVRRPELGEVPRRKSMQTVPLSCKQQSTTGSTQSPSRRRNSLPAFGFGRNRLRPTEPKVTGSSPVGCTSLRIAVSPYAASPNRLRHLAFRALSLAHFATSVGHGDRCSAGFSRPVSVQIGADCDAERKAV